MISGIVVNLGTVSEYQGLCPSLVSMPTTVMAKLPFRKKYSWQCISFLKIYSMWLFMELGCYYKISKQKGEKNCYRKKYRFEPEPDLNRTWTEVQFKVRPDARTGPLVQFSVHQKWQRTGLNWTSATLITINRCRRQFSKIMYICHGSLYGLRVWFTWRFLNSNRNKTLSNRIKEVKECNGG